jgi:hypothetical protein
LESADLGDCACVIGDFKLNHPSTYGIADAGYIVFGRIGREYFGLAFVLCELKDLCAF